MKINIFKWTLAAGLLMGTATSCSEWLEVDMEDSILENTLYSTNDGYLTALNGIYSELNQGSVYGSALSMGYVDIMAQYYNISDAVEHSLSYYSLFKFEQDEFKTATTSTWTQMYKLIANLNVLLEHCDAEDSALYPRYYPIVKGEALALRAMLHFDLLRLFGPVYNAESAATLCMPYQETSKKEIQPMLSAETVLSKVIRDLEEADKLLVEDPIITEGIKDNETSDDGLDNYDFSYRQIRLNHYAVKALLARAYLWKGDKTKTYSIVKNDIIDKVNAEELDVFPWMTKEQFEATVVSERPDFLYSSEVIFGLYNMRRYSTHRSLFAPTVETNARLNFVGEDESSANSKLATFYDDGNDIRKQMWTKEATTSSSNDDEDKESYSICLAKYSEGEGISSSDTYRYLIPLIRMSEIYLMAAECTSDITEAAKYINWIRNLRSCGTIEVNADNLQECITKEFAREVIGEGQLFFYYKRLAMEKVISGTKAGQMENMSLSNYVLPLPEEETNERE